ncbi:MAG: pyruvate dehydrogenase complex dihydrolipoamide acetyltransferase [Bacteroidota bacterium]|nr:pyruvate dehydrogenase complex dihydrolipoamide acetyltransferase [Bacteroidota bacterium]MDP4211714.1 pyruvate dehydrogenase complex dihydrolipoamide acetyltransferase [Bacteroidota bacterium]MDP4250414.1 pyruvate dehydrogenase complex dihydrolipoamide acetyltransferase [Bacteroidota bacterium]
MADVILMPRLSDTMTEGVIAAWHKKVGDTVKKGDLLAEVETDKATMDLESYKDGTLLFTGTDKGGKVQVNELLAIIGKPGEDISSLVKTGGTSKTAATTDSASAKPNAAPSASEKNATAPAPKPAAPAQDLASMQEVILMPRLSDTMTEGVVADWHKKVGDSVKKGDILADIETDKATMELESYKEGKLLYTGAEKGQKIAVNDLLAIIGEEGKVNVQQIVDASKNKGTAAPIAPKEEKPAAANTESAPAEPQQPSLNGDGRIKASPLAKKLATEKGIDLSRLHGSGDNGRIVKKDVSEYHPAEVPVTAGTAKPQAGVSAPAGQVSFDEVPVSQMRRIIAKRLAESKFSAPHFYLNMSVDMDKAVDSRSKLNETSPVKISFNDMVLKAVAVALKKHPAVNSSWLGDKIRINHHVNIGVAVAVEDGLLVPVVRFADGKSLSQIATEVKDFAQRAKLKKLQPSDWEGSTFTISNLGMFGIDDFTAIINPPDACILAIGAIQQIPVVKNGVVVPGNIMRLTLSCDHRVVDGATGAAFLQTLKGLLEEPLRMLI